MKISPFHNIQYILDLTNHGYQTKRQAHPTLLKFNGESSHEMSFLLIYLQLRLLQQLCYYWNCSIRFIINILILQITLTTLAQMTQRKIWKVQEDQILKQLFEVRKVKKWSEISRIMEKNYGIQGRNGKQCRQRYHNHLKGGIKKEKWSKEEENQLVELHALHGNRWALISKLIEGRTQNCVKNMLYSKLRKSIRQLNRFSYQYYRKTLKEIKISFIYRLIQFTENSYKKTEQERTQQEKIALKLKNEILQLNYDEDDEIPESEKSKIKQLIQQIHVFKRLNQRFRGNHGTKNKGRRIIKTQTIEEADQGPSLVDEYSEGEDQIMENEADFQQAMQQQEVRVKTQEQFNLKKDIGETIIKALDTAASYPEQVKEPTNNFKSKVSILRMDSIESNLSLLLVDSGLQNAIHTEHQFVNLTPTPYHRQGIIEDWSNLSSTWRNNFTFD